MTCAYNLCSPITKRGKILYFSSAYNSSFFYYFYCSLFLALKHIENAMCLQRYPEDSGSDDDSPFDAYYEKSDYEVSIHAPVAPTTEKVA